MLKLKLELSLSATDLEPKWLRKIAWNWGFHWVGNIDQTPKMIPAQTPNMIVGLSISPYLPHFRPSRPSANNRGGHWDSNALIGADIAEWGSLTEVGNLAKIQASGNP